MTSAENPFKGTGVEVAGRCTDCRSVLPAAAHYCWECGKPVEEEQDAVGVDTAVTLLHIDDSGEVVARFPIKKEETTIGRVDADINFSDDYFLSPLHAKITRRAGRIDLRDLGSRNSTWWFIDGPYTLQDGDRVLIGSQILTFRRLGYPGPHPPELDSTRRLGSLTPSADIASVTQMRSDGSNRDVLHLSPGRDIAIGRERGEWTFPYDPSMSGTHAEIRSEDADFILVDSGSRNGTAVAVRGDLELKDGYRFLVGDRMLRIEIR